MKRSPTLIGQPAPPSNHPPSAPDDGDRDSVVEAVRSASSLADELGARARQLKAAEDEAANLRTQLKQAADNELERTRLRSKWEELALKLGGGIVTVVIALCGYGAWRISQIEHKTDTADEQAKAQKAAIEGVPARMTAVEEYLRAQATIAECKESQSRSATFRTTGYDLTSLSDKVVVHWSSEGTKPNLTWFPIEQCVPPSSAPLRPPGAQASP